MYSRCVKQHVYKISVQMYIRYLLYRYMFVTNTKVKRV